MTELWKAVSWFRDADHFSISAEICRLLFPDGAPGPSKYQKLGLNPGSLNRFLSSGDVGAPDLMEPEAEAAARSLLAFVSYHQLYQLWWRNSSDGSSQDKLVNGNAAEPCGTSSIDGLDFDVLLSEKHAAHQAVQRSVTEVQGKLSTMVLQHSRAQGDQPGPVGGESDSQRSANAEKRTLSLFLLYN